MSKFLQLLGKLKPNQIAGGEPNTALVTNADGNVEWKEESIYSLKSTSTDPIPDNAYNGRSDLISIYTNATEIGELAFGACLNLQSFCGPRVTNINNAAFRGCRNLQTVTLSSTLNTITGTEHFQACSSLLQINLYLLKEIPAYMFRNCYNLRYVRGEKVTKLGPGAFAGNSLLTEVYLPMVETIESSSTDSTNGTFGSCVELRRLAFPNLKTFPNSNYALMGVYSLEYLDLGLVEELPVNFVNGACSLTCLILRSNTMCTVAGVPFKANCCHYTGTVHAKYNPTGLKDGYIYVPAALIDSYKAATNWSAYADQFRAIEDYPEICYPNTSEPVTETKVNSLIDAKLGVIENGTY